MMSYSNPNDVRPSVCMKHFLSREITFECGIIKSYLLILIANMILYKYFVVKGMGISARAFKNVL
jgi:hypothetical protein